MRGRCSKGRRGLVPRFRYLIVVAWTNEEGARFQPSLLGSSVFSGILGADHALAVTDGAGLSLGSALQEIGMTVIGTSVRKSTEDDKQRIRELMGEEASLFGQIPARELYGMLAAGDADILMSGGRTQFVALKTKTPWLDINQERHHAYAGYEGMVALVRQIDGTIHHPVWRQVRRPAPWQTAGANP